MTDMIPLPLWSAYVHCNDSGLYPPPPPPQSGGISGALGQVLGVTGDALAKLSFDTEHQEIRHQRSGSMGRAIGGVAIVRNIGSS